MGGASTCAAGPGTCAKAPGTFAPGASTCADALGTCAYVPRICADDRSTCVGGAQYGRMHTAHGLVQCNHVPQGTPCPVPPSVRHCITSTPCGAAVYLRVPTAHCPLQCGGVQREAPEPVARGAHQGPCWALRHHGVGGADSPPSAHCSAAVYRIYTACSPQQWGGVQQEPLLPTAQGIVVVSRIHHHPLPRAVG